MTADDLVHDWNPPPAARQVQVVDETLRDGLQGGVPRWPSIAERIGLIERSAALGVRELTIGFPAHETALANLRALCAGVAERGIDVRLGVLARTIESDIEHIARLRDGTDAQLTAWVFLGASPIRAAAESWSTEQLIATADRELGRAASLGLPVNFGIEDSARGKPELLEQLLKTAQRHRVETVSICDTVGCLTPMGARAIIRFARAVLNRGDHAVQLDFHNHRDRGLALACALAAVDEGADRIHATMLGIGERAGNCPLDLLLVNLVMMGWWRGGLERLADYAKAVASACGLSIPEQYPVLGSNAFRTQAGVHAAAILKAELSGRPRLAALVYSSVDPTLVGRTYDVEIGPASGRANVLFGLRLLGLVPREAVIQRVLELARCEGRTIGLKELRCLYEDGDDPQNWK